MMTDRRLAQCLIVLVEGKSVRHLDDVPTTSDPPNTSDVLSDTDESDLARRSVLLKTRTITVEAYLQGEKRSFALLPEALTAQHPTILQRLRQLGILTLDDEAVSSISPSEIVRIVEVLLDENNSNPLDKLYTAGYGNDFTIARLFSVKPWRIDEFRYKSIRSAVDDANLGIIDRLLSSRPTAINCKFGPNLQGTLLEMAARLGHLALVNLSLNHGKKMRLREGIPVHHAVKAGSPATVQLLAEAGADVNKTDSVHDTPLGLLVGPHHLDDCTKLDLAKMLVKYGAEPLARRGPTSNQHISQSILLCCSYNLEDGLFSYFLRTCFTEPRIFKDVLVHRACVQWFGQSPLEIINFRKRFAEHVVKITTLFRSSDLDEDLPSLWSDDLTGLAEFKGKCEAEILCLRNTKFANTHLPLFDLLRSSDRNVSRLLGNESVLQETSPGRWSSVWFRFPLYGTMMNERIEKIKSLNVYLSEANKSFESLSRHFKSLPDEIKEHILRLLSYTDLARLKRAGTSTDQQIKLEL